LRVPRPFGPLGGGGVDLVSSEAVFAPAQQAARSAARPDVPALDLAGQTAAAILVGTPAPRARALGQLARSTSANVVGSSSSRSRFRPSALPSHQLGQVPSESSNSSSRSA
jgi:hypothetical protein